MESTDPWPAIASDLVARLVNNDRLNAIAIINDIGALVMQHITGVIVPPGKKNMITTVEALVGAAYQDGGLEAAETVMRNLGIVDE